MSSFHIHVSANALDFFCFSNAVSEKHKSIDFPFARGMHRHFNSLEIRI